MKVRIIEKTSSYDLQDQVNKILAEYSASEIFDIKYAECPLYGSAYYSAMIIFK